MIQRNGKILYVLGLEELILLKWSCYSKQFTDLTQSPSFTHDIFHRTGKKKNPKLCLKL